MCRNGWIKWKQWDDDENIDESSHLSVMSP